MMLDQLSPEAYELLKDKPVSARTINKLRRLKPTHQVAAARFMISTGNYSLFFAKALLIATGSEERENRGIKSIRGLTREQQTKMQQELERLLSDIGITETYGADVLSLVVACGYISKLIGNKAIAQYLHETHPKILRELRSIVATGSLSDPAAEGY